MRAPRFIGLLTVMMLAAVCSVPRSCAAELNRAQRRRISKLLKSSRDKKKSTYGIARQLSGYGPAVVPHLIEALENRDGRMRSCAERALKTIGAPAGPAVVEIAGKGNHHARTAAARLLREYKPRPAGAVDALVKMLDHKEETTRRAAAYSLSVYGPDAASGVSALTRSLKDKDRWVASYSAGALGKIGKPAVSSTNELLSASRHTDLVVRAAALRALGGIGAPYEKALPALLTGMNDARHEVRIAAVQGVGSLKPPPARVLPALTARLSDKSYKVIQAAIQAIGEMGAGGAPAVNALSAKLSNSLHAAYAMTALGNMGPAASAAVPALEDRVADASEKIHKAALEALAKVRPGYKPSGEVLKKRRLRLLGVRLGDYNTKTRSDAAKEIARMGEYAVPELLRLLKKGTDQRRIMAAYTLNLMHGPISTAREVGESAGDSSSVVGANCALVVMQMGPAGKAAVPGMIKALETYVPKAYSLGKTRAESEAKRKRLIAEALAAIGPAATAALPALEAASKDKNATVRAAALKAIAGIKGSVAQAKNTSKLSGKLRKLSEYRTEIAAATKLMQARKLNEAYKIFSAVIVGLDRERELSGYNAAAKAMSAAGKDEKARREAMILLNAANARLGGAEPTGRDPETGKLVVPMMAQLNGQVKMNYLHQAYLSRAGIWYAARKYDSAIADLNKLLEYSSYNRKAYFMRAGCHERKRDYARAEKDYAAVITWGKTKSGKPEELNYQAHVGRSRTYARRKMHAQALKDLEIATAMYPDRSEAYLARIQIWIVLRKHADKVKDYTQLLRLARNTTSRAFMLQSRAESLVTLGRYREAVADYSALIKISPKNIDYYHLRGRTRNYLGDHENALIDLNRAVAARPKIRRYLKDRGWAHLGLKSYDKAIADFGAAISRPGADDDAALLLGPAPVPWDAYLGRGNCYRSKGDIAKAVADYREAVKRNPRHSGTLNTLAWILATHGDAKIRNGKEAVKHAEALVKLSVRREPAHLDTLAAAYAEYGRFKDAVRTQKEAISKLGKRHSKALADELAGHLKKFEAGKPHHEPKH